MDTITYIYMYTVNIACLHSVIHVQTVYIHYKFSHLICSSILVTCIYMYIQFCRLMRRWIKVADPRIYLVSAAYIHIREEVVNEYQTIT